jgi:ankyrin repeat protein
MSVVGTVYEPTYHGMSSPHALIDAFMTSMMRLVKRLMFPSLCSILLKGSDLLDAVRLKNLPLVHLLVTQGANVNRFDREGYTALHWGSLSGSLDIVVFLVLNGAKVNIHSSDGEGVTPLMSATGKGFLDIIRFLVEHGAELTATDARGCTALAHAVQYDEIFAAHLLIKMGCSPLECDTGGHSLLHWSSYYGFYHLTDYLLLNYTINVDQADNDGRTPMYWASSRGLRAICKLLVDHGGDVHSHDHEGKTPIDVADHEKYHELANLMKTGQLSAIPRETAVYSWKDVRLVHPMFNECSMNDQVMTSNSVLTHSRCLYVCGEIGFSRSGKAKRFCEDIPHAHFHLYCHPFCASSYWSLRLSCRCVAIQSTLYVLPLSNPEGKTSSQEWPHD